MKIFVSYSRKDSDFAEQVHDYLKDSGHDIFIDINDIKPGDLWNSTIEENILNCDIFVIIVTYAALSSPEVEKEVLNAKAQKKKIIPVIHQSVKYADIKWDLNKIQGIEFGDKYELARSLDLKITRNQEEKSLNVPMAIRKRQKSKIKLVIPFLATYFIIGLLTLLFGETLSFEEPSFADFVPLLILIIIIGIILSLTDPIGALQRSLLTGLFNRHNKNRVFNLDRIPSWKGNLLVELNRLRYHTRLPDTLMICLLSNFETF
jgi:hypothetical protein